MGSSDSHCRRFAARYSLALPSTPETATRRAVGGAQSTSAIRSNFSIKAHPNRMVHSVADEPLESKGLELGIVQ
jgi:hypothetical protein